MGRHSQRRSGDYEDGRTQSQSAAHILRLERRDEERRPRIFPDSGADGHHRIRSATGRSRSYPYDLSRSDQRLRGQTGEAMKTGLLTIALAFALLGSPETARAHRLDEYLQAARFSIERYRLDFEIDLTPGSAVAARVFSLIDANRDGRISEEEGQAYSEQLRRAIQL